MIYKKQESLLPPDLLQLLLRPISEAAVALARLDERIARSPVGEGFLERSHFLDAHASLWVYGELVHLEKTSSCMTSSGTSAHPPTNSPSPATS